MIGNIRNYKSMGDKKLALELKKLEIKMEEVKAKGTVPDIHSSKHRLSEKFVDWLGILTLGLILVASIKGNRTAILGYLEKKAAYDNQIPAFYEETSKQNESIIKLLESMTANTNMLITQNTATTPKTVNGSDTSKTKVRPKGFVGGQQQPIIKETPVVKEVSEQQKIRMFRQYQSFDNLVTLICIKNPEHGAYHAIMDNGIAKMRCDDCNDTRVIPINMIQKFVK